eukprot:1158068-Pelagomonas_calceolata.AAC.2
MVWKHVEQHVHRSILSYSPRQVQKWISLKDSLSQTHALLLSYKKFQRQTICNLKGRPSFASQLHTLMQCNPPSKKPSFDEMLYFPRGINVSGWRVEGWPDVWKACLE